MLPAHSTVCFASRATLTLVNRELPLRLAASAQEALAQLLPVLLCGEESAALTFARLATAGGFSRHARATLDAIANDERRHERQLQELRQALPPVSVDAELQRASRRFFARIGGRDPGMHFARIAALDSGLCVLLGALRAPGSVLAADANLSVMFSQIHGDEARHVLASRHYACLLVGKRLAWAAGLEMRERLVGLMSLRGDALEALGIDPDRLFERLRRVPRRLFS